jgi:hypothetical protein
VPNTLRRYLLGAGFRIDYRVGHIVVYRR